MMYLVNLSTNAFVFKFSQSIYLLICMSICLFIFLLFFCLSLYRCCFFHFIYPNNHRNRYICLHMDLSLFFFFSCVHLTVFLPSWRLSCERSACMTTRITFLLVYLSISKACHAFIAFKTRRVRILRSNFNNLTILSLM